MFWANAIHAEKFNHKASDGERREMLEAILAHDPNTLSEDDGPRDDANLNEMLTRSEGELERFELLETSWLLRC